MSAAVETKPLAWRRPTKDVLATGTKRRSWTSQCNHYRLEEHRHVGGNVLYLAFARDVAGIRVYWRNIGLVRSRQVAAGICERHFCREAE